MLDGPREWWGGLSGKQKAAVGIAAGGAMLLLAVRGRSIARTVATVARGGRERGYLLAGQQALRWINYPTFAAKVAAIRQALIEAAYDLELPALSENQLRIFIAQAMLEAGDGGVPNHAYWGIKASRGHTGGWHVVGTQECAGQDCFGIRDRFRAYATAREAARDYLNFWLIRGSLTAGKIACREVARNGDPLAFATCLQRNAYFTAPPERYARNMTVRLAQVDAVGAGRGIAVA